jgi:hypothetical protein
MPRMSDKEKCFDKAWNKYKDATGSRMKIESQKPWGLRSDGKWDKNYSNWQHAINSFRKWLTGNGGSTQQIRFPDLTITNDGATSVVDLKFTRKDGRVDQWGNTEGKGNRRVQKDDYNQINKQQNGGRNPYPEDDPSLDPVKCDCGKKTKVQRERVVKLVPAEPQFFYVPGVTPSPIPGVVPGSVPATGPGVMVRPIIELVPVW